MRLLHTADWQIGKVFANIPGDPGAVLRHQRLRTVAAIAELARERQVDAVLVAGDVFETNTVGDETLARTLEAMRGYPGPWVLLPGNHDAALAESVWKRLQRHGLPANVHLALEPAPLVLTDGRLAVLPAPLTRRHESYDLTEAFDTMETPPGAIRVGLAHGAVENRLPAEAESYNPISDRRAVSARLDYLALGDWHGTLEIAERTWYAGTPEPDRFRNNDAGNVLLVEIAAPGARPKVERIAVGHFRWRSLEFAVNGVEDLTALDAALSALGEPYDRLVVELTLRGTIGLAERRELDQRLQRWSARCHYLRLDDSRLIPQASDADLDQISATGFLQDALARLRAIQNDPTHPDQALAAPALQRLYTEYLNTRS